MSLGSHDVGVPHGQFGDHLYRHMRRRYMRASHLADKLDLHRATVGRWLNGTHRPDPDVVVRLADLLLLTGRAREQFLLCWFGETIHE